MGLLETDDYFMRLGIRRIQNPETFNESLFDAGNSFGIRCESILQ